MADKNLIGAAGEHLVLSRLLSRGILASQAPRGTRKADILVNPLDGGKPKLIQVKSTSSGSGPVGWKMKDEHMTEKSTDLIYCFVDFRNKTWPNNGLVSKITHVWPQPFYPAL